MSEHSRTMIEFAAILTPITSALFVGFLHNVRQIAQMETKIDAMWNWFTNERMHPWPPSGAPWDGIERRKDA